MGGWRAHLLSIPPFILPVGSNHYQWYMVIGPSYRLKDDFIDGVRPAEEVLNEIHALCGRGVSRSQLSQVMGLLAGELPPERIRTIASLREKYRVYVLSNINDSLWQTSVRQIEALGLSVADCFDATFLYLDGSTVLTCHCPLSPNRRAKAGHASN